LYLNPKVCQYLKRLERFKRYELRDMNYEI
jgi:hypothetical protein